MPQVNYALSEEVCPVQNPLQSNFPGWTPILVVFWWGEEKPGATFLYDWLVQVTEHPNHSNCIFLRLIGKNELTFFKNRINEFWGMGGG